MSMICDHATKCGDKANGCCVISRPHVCEECHPVDSVSSFCYIVERYVRCTPIHRPRSYDADGRAARREAIRLARLALGKVRLKQAEPMLGHGYAVGIMDASLEILRVMREARKGAK
jgi:hypothetical protein